MRNTWAPTGPSMWGHRSGLVTGLVFSIDIAQQNRLDRGESSQLIGHSD